MGELVDVGGEQGSRSSVSVRTNAKGEVQIEVKVYTSDLDGVDAARVKAVETFELLREEVGA